MGLVIFAIRGETPAFSYHSMIKLFCETGGATNDALSRVIALLKGKYAFVDKSGCLGDMAGPEGQAAAANLRHLGYHVFHRRLPAETCSALVNFASTCKSLPVRMDGQSSDGALEIYSREAPRAVRYEIPPTEVLGQAEVQDLLADRSFAALAQEYLGTKPVLDVISMWWHTSFSAQPDKNAAQYFHFDMDRIKWLKFFVYLTDVTPSSGPHTFVAGSHRTGAIGDELLGRGYSRLGDEEVLASFGPDRIVEFSAPAGTIIVEDTRGLHKGRHVEQGDRLILQIQFSNTLFGASYAKHCIGASRTPALLARIEEFPGLFEAYL